MVGDPAACVTYHHSAYGAGRKTACYTAKSPSLYEGCAEWKNSAHPVGVDSGTLQGLVIHRGVRELCDGEMRNSFSNYPA